MTRPVLRWAGSKRKLLPTLIKCVPQNYGRYVEPFAGSACLFFALRPHAAILSDFNEDLIQTYRVIRSRPRQLARELVRIPTNRQNYYRVRKRFQGLTEKLERATTFVYLNRLCFNGIYRTNRRGWFNVPCGTHTGALPSEQDLVDCGAALRAASLVACDFEDTLSMVRRNDFVYLDPPYATGARPSFGEYGYGCFAEADLDRLVEAVHSLNRIGAIVLFSYAAVVGICSRFAGWHFRHLSVRRDVAADVSRRLQSQEIIISNRPLPPFV
jgi:DNA adenine methylase